MDAPEVHAPHIHPVGHRWFDIAMGCSALLVSAISLYVAVHHGETMEKLVQANSFPSVDVRSALTRGNRPDAIRYELSLANNGVGPARVRTLELWVGALPIRSIDDLGKSIKRASGGAVLKARVDGDTVIGRLIGAREERRLVGIEVAPASIWTKPMLQTANALQSRICYCSVFDECYVADTRQKATVPDHVAACPVPPAPYGDDLGQMLIQKLDPPSARKEPLRE